MDPVIFYTKAQSPELAMGVLFTVLIVTLFSFNILMLHI